MTEIWKPVPGYKDLYAVSDRGRLKRTQAACGTHTGRMLNPTQDRDGYFRVTLSKANKKRTRTIHYLVTAAFIGPRPPLLQINHINGNPQDNRLANLEYVSHAENQLHSYRCNGRVQNRGSENGKAVLAEGDVRAIKQMLAKGTAQIEVAAAFSVSHSTISLINSGKTWKHVD